MRHIPSIFGGLDVYFSIYGIFVQKPHIMKHISVLLLLLLCGTAMAGTPEWKSGVRVDTIRYAAPGPLDKERAGRMTLLSLCHAYGIPETLTFFLESEGFQSTHCPEKRWKNNRDDGVAWNDMSSRGCRRRL